jgi:hypothetical protein
MAGNLGQQLLGDRYIIEIKLGEGGVGITYLARNQSDELRVIKTPPEQYVPDAERGEFIDVYALAATLYSLLTGQVPMSVPVRLQNFTLRSPKDLNSSVGDRVNDTIMHGMALKKDSREYLIYRRISLTYKIIPVSFK